MNYDGWLSIGTDIDSKEFDKELKRLKKESDKFTKEEEKLLTKKASLEVDYREYLSELDEIRKAYDDTVKHCTSKEQIGFETDIANQKIERINNKYTKTLNELENVNTKIKENAINQEQVKRKIEETELKAKGLHFDFNQVGKSLTNTVKKVAKWAVAIFGVGSAYNAVRNAASILLEYNDEMKNKIESIKLVFATALEPIITKIVNLVYKLMTYMNYISKAWFGVDLFAKANEKSLSKSNKSAKDLKKTLNSTKFDEMNVLSDNKQNNSTSDFSFAKPDDVPIPEWIQWIADNKDTVLKFFKELGILILAIKIGEFLLELGNIGKGFSKLLKFLSPLISGLGKFASLLTNGVGKGISSLIGMLKSMSGLQILGLVAGVIMALEGVINLIKGIIAFIKDPSWENFNKILGGLTLTIIGVGVAMTALNASNPIGWIMIAIGVVVGLITAVSSLTESFFHDSAQILSTKEAQEQLTEAIEKSKNATNDYVNAVDNAENALQKLEEAENKTGLSGEELYKSVQNGTLDYKEMDSVQREVYKAYLNNKDAQEKLQISTENLTNAKKEEKDASWENQLAIANESKKYDEFKKSVVDAYNKGEIKAGEARDYIERAMKDMSTSSSDTFTKDLPNDIKEGLDPKHYQSTWTKFKNGFTDVCNNIKNGISGAFDWVKSKFGFSKGGIIYDNYSTGFAKGGIVYPKLKYCATGAIINQPGRGVPITQAVGGERGQEGILPLTDSQQMDLLGSAIARHMSINVTTINQMNGRTISKELKRIDAQQGFATNS